MRWLLIGLFIIGSKLSYASAGCSKETQKEFLKIRNLCLSSKYEICNSISKEAKCDEIIKAFAQESSKRLVNLQKSLFSKETNRDGVKLIKKELNTILSMSKIIYSKDEFKTIKKQIINFSKMINKMEKSDSKFLDQIQHNGMTNREIAFKLLQDDTKNKLAAAYFSARNKYKSDKKNKVTNGSLEKYFKQELINDKSLASIIPLTNKSDRSIANIGLVLFTCEYASNKHILLIGRSECGDRDAMEWTVGLGAFYQYQSPGEGMGGEGAAFVCLSSDEKFRGIGVSAAASGVIFPTAHVGAYIGTGVCIKVGMGAFTSIGAFAGVSYLKIDSDGINISDEMFDLLRQ